MTASTAQYGGTTSQFLAITTGCAISDDSDATYAGNSTCTRRRTEANPSILARCRYRREESFYDRDSREAVDLLLGFQTFKIIVNYKYQF